MMRTICLTDGNSQILLKEPKDLVKSCLETLVSPLTTIKNCATNSKLSKIPLITEILLICANLAAFENAPGFFEKFFCVTRKSAICQQVQRSINSSHKKVGKAEYFKGREEIFPFTSGSYMKRIEDISAAVEMLKLLCHIAHIPMGQKVRERKLL